MPTILLADDSVTIRKVVELTFGELGHTVLVAADGDQALELLRQRRPDIVLADAVMPGKSGYEVCQYVKGEPRLKGVPVLLLAGKFEPFDESRAKQVGADAHIFKPFQGSVLVQAVNGLLEKAAAIVSTPAPVAVEPESVIAAANPLATEDPIIATPGLDDPTAPSMALEEDASPFGSASVPVDDRTTPNLDPFDEGPGPFGGDGQPEAVLSKVQTIAHDEPFAAVSTPASGGVALSDAPAFEEFAPLEASAPAPVSEPIVAIEVPVPVIAAARSATLPAMESAAGAGIQASDGVSLDDFPEEILEAIAQRVVRKLAEDSVKEVVWQIVPELAELMIKRKLEELG